MYVFYSRVRPIFNRRTSWGGFHGSRYRRLWSLEEKEEEEEEEELQRRWRAKPRKRSNTLLEEYFLGL